MLQLDVRNFCYITVATWMENYANYSSVTSSVKKSQNHRGSLGKRCQIKPANNALTTRLQNRCYKQLLGDKHLSKFQNRSQLLISVSKFNMLSQAHFLYLWQLLPGGFRESEIRTRNVVLQYIAQMNVKVRIVQNFEKCFKYNFRLQRCRIWNMFNGEIMRKLWTG